MKVKTSRKLRKWISN